MARRSNVLTRVNCGKPVFGSIRTNIERTNLPSCGPDNQLSGSSPAHAPGVGYAIISSSACSQRHDFVSQHVLRYVSDGYIRNIFESCRRVERWR